ACRPRPCTPLPGRRSAPSSGCGGAGGSACRGGLPPRPGRTGPRCPRGWRGPSAGRRTARRIVPSVTTFRVKSAFDLVHPADRRKCRWVLGPTLHALALAAAPDAEDREADEPEGQVVVGLVQLVEVRRREH